MPSLHRASLSGSFSSCSRDSVLFHSEDMIWFKGNHPWLACECAGSYSLCCVLAFVCPGLIIHLIPVLDFTEKEMNMEGINSWQKWSGLETRLLVSCRVRYKIFILMRVHLAFLLHCFKMWMSSISKTQISPTCAIAFTSEGGHLLLNGWTVKYEYKRITDKGKQHHTVILKCPCLSIIVRMSSYISKYRKCILSLY